MQCSSLRVFLLRFALLKFVVAKYMQLSIFVACFGHRLCLTRALQVRNSSSVYAYFQLRKCVRDGCVGGGQVKWISFFMGPDEVMSDPFLHVAEKVDILTIILFCNRDIYTY